MLSLQNYTLVFFCNIKKMSERGDGVRVCGVVEEGEGRCETFKSKLIEIVKKVIHFAFAFRS